MRLGYFVDLYARNSGMRDKLVAERDVVLTYALRVLLDRATAAATASRELALLGIYKTARGRWLYDSRR